MITQHQLNILKNNIQKIIQLFVNKKFELWLMTHYYDSKYISNFSKTQSEKETNDKITQFTIQEKGEKGENTTQNNSDSHIKNKCISYLDDIYHTKNIYLKYKKALNITNDSHNITLKDSFHGNRSSVDEMLNNAFSNDKYHIVIFGAGPSGLYMANLLKLHYKDKIEIIIIENGNESKCSIGKSNEPSTLL